jgi:cytochrome c
MDSFEFNKMAGAVLGSMLVVFGLSELSGIIYHADTPEKQGYVIEVAEAGTGGENSGAEEPAAESLGALLAKADAAAGQKVAKVCLTCHDLAKGGPNKTGPNLWDVVMRAPGTHADYKYSDAMAAKSGEPWTYEALDVFLTNPTKAVPGTKMNQKVAKAGDRANLLAYLATLSDAPKPFPAP